MLALTVTLEAPHVALGEVADPHALPSQALVAVRGPSALRART